VAIEAAHVRWHSQQGPDEVAKALALCALHHALFDLGVLGITEDRRIRVSSLYVVRNEAGQAVDALAGKPLLIRAYAGGQPTSFKSPGTIGRSSRQLSEYRSRSAHAEMSAARTRLLVYPYRGIEFTGQKFRKVEKTLDT
jgi:hypothetical protein